MDSPPACTSSAFILSTPTDFPFCSAATAFSIPHGGLAVDLLLVADCSPVSYCHHNSHSCIADEADGSVVLAEL